MHKVSKAYLTIEKTEKYYLIFKIIISNLRTRFIFITFSNFYLIICNQNVDFDKLLRLAQFIKKFS